MARKSFLIVFGAAHVTAVHLTVMSNLVFPMRPSNSRLVDHIGWPALVLFEACVMLTALTIVVLTSLVVGQLIIKAKGIVGGIKTIGITGVTMVLFGLAVVLPDAQSDLANFTEMDLVMVVKAIAVTIICYVILLSVHKSRQDRTPRHLRQRKGRCTHCGYELGELEVCPECGAEA